MPDCGCVPKSLVRQSDSLEIAWCAKLRNGKDGGLLNPDVVNPYLDKVVLWFEDADMAEEPTTFQTYSDKLAEVEEFIKKEGAPYFEKKAKDAWKKSANGTP